MGTDYVSKDLELPNLDALFPDMIVGDTDALTWPYFRRGISHNWYTDRRDPQIGFINKDEASILYSSARLFAGRRGLEIGAWRGWSTCHLVAAGLASLHVVEPKLRDEAWRREFAEAVARAGGAERAVLVPGESPAAVRELGESGLRWSFAFIDGDHEGDAPTRDALACEPYLEPTAMVLFHDLVSPHVCAALRALEQRGWGVMVYQTAQMMGVAWRGAVQPVRHIPDPSQTWSVPDHIKGLAISPQP
jgi:predicted O-methyltransferase YrrM